MDALQVILQMHLMQSNGCPTQKYSDALDVIKWMIYRQHVDALELTILDKFQSPKGCPTNGPVGALGLYIQMDSQVIGHPEGTWIMCQYGFSTDGHVDAHRHCFVIVHYGCSADGHAEAQ